MNSSFIRFGVFELDLTARELRKRGVRVKLQDQPFRVLEALVEKPGEIVTREQLKDRLWAQDEFVEFDKSLNTSVQKIRHALGDSASSPRFVETVPKVGYRFLAPAETAVASGPPPIASRRTLTLAALLVASAAIAATAWWRLNEGQQPDFRPGAPRQLSFDAGLTWQPTISPDGKLVAYASDRAGDAGLDIWVQQTAGGEPLRLTEDPADDYQPDFSPDGESIVFRSAGGDSGIYKIPVLGGTAVKLVDEGFRPRYSPTGEWILYNSARTAGPLRIVRANGSADQSVAGPIAYWFDPIWVSEREILVADWTSDDPDWLVIPIDPDASVVRTHAAAKIATLSAGAVAHPRSRGNPVAWDPHSRQVVFVAQTGDARSLWRLTLDRQLQAVGRPRPITFGSGENRHADIARDGAVVFGDLRSESKIWSLQLNADSAQATGEFRRLNERSGSEEWPTLSRDGRRLLYESDRGGSSNLYLQDLETGKLSQVTESLSKKFFPVLSPDAQAAVFRGIEESGVRQYMLRFDRPSAEVLCETCTGLARSWLPAKEGILWQDTSEKEIRLTDLPSRDQTVVAKGEEISPASVQASPDGEWMTFIGAKDSKLFALFVAPLDRRSVVPEREWIRIVDEQATYNRPRWAPSGNRIYFTSDLDGFACIWTIELDPVTKVPSSEPQAVQHLHNPALSLSRFHLGAHELSIGPDKLVISVSERSGNIWIMEPTNVE